MLKVDPLSTSLTQELCRLPALLAWCSPVVFGTDPELDAAFVDGCMLRLLCVFEDRLRFDNALGNCSRQAVAASGPAQRVMRVLSLPVFAQRSKNFMI